MPERRRPSRPERWCFGVPVELARLGPLSERRAVISADRSILHGSVIAALDILERAGVRRIAFAVAPSK